MEIRKEDAHIIKTIKSAEVLAKECVEVSISQDYFEIKNKAINDDHLEKLSKQYVYKLVEEYDSTENIYKASNFNFKFIQSQTEQELTEIDRLEFIEMIILSTINGDKTSDEDYHFALNVLQQLKELERIVYDTKLLELKIDHIKKELKNDEAKSNTTRTHIAYCIHYLAQTKSLKLKNVFPSDKAWTEIGLQYNKNAKNIQQMYNEINSSIDVRTSKTRIKIIEYVIKKMLVDYPKAQKLAEDELKIALLKS